MKIIQIYSLHLPFDTRNSNLQVFALYPLILVQEHHIPIKIRLIAKYEHGFPRVEWVEDSLAKTMSLGRRVSKPAHGVKQLVIN